MPAADLDALILAASPHAQTRVVGLSLVERGRRVAARLGARRILVVDESTTAAELRRWRAEAPDAALLALRAGDQVIHTPLAEPLLAGTTDRRVAIAADGAYAGALRAQGAAAGELIDAIAGAPTGDAELARRWREAGAETFAHGDIARHPATTEIECAAAEQMLLRLLVKAEDGPVTRYVYRPVSRPITRLLVKTPITPNHVSLVVLVIGMIGCWITAQPGRSSLIIGASLVLCAGFIDGCDGEIARLRLLSSKFGAWFDTIVDELTTTVYFVAIGYHTYREMPDAAWIAPSIVIGAVCYAISVYGIYYFLVVVSKTGNSQHYVGSLDIVDDPRHGLGLRPKPAAASTLSPRMRLIAAALEQTVRRDFINLGSLALSFANAYLVIYVVMLAGGVVAAAIILPGHLRLRVQLRELRRRGAPKLLPSV